MSNPSPKEISDPFEPFVYDSTEKEILVENFPKRSSEFLDVLFSRNSNPSLNQISKQELSELLFLSAKIRRVEEDKYGFLISKRTTPSAGARHPIDLLISLGQQDSKRNLHYYNPIDHSLNKLPIPEINLSYFFEEVNNNVPLNDACMIWFCIQINKTGSKYENPESLYWKDTGALLYCLQLVAQFLNLKSCPLGSLAADSFPKLFSNDKLISGGGIIIGK